MSYISSVHMKMLVEDSKIDPGIFSEFGFKSVNASEAQALGFEQWQARSGLAYAISPPDGSNGLYGLRPDTPRKSKSGRLVKYEHIYGKPPRLDVPKRCQQFKDDPSINAIITEGTKKIASLLSNVPGDWLSINLVNGVYGWLQDRKPIGDMDLINWRHRKCFLVFDNDLNFKPQVHYALRWLSSELKKRGATIHIVYLPEDGGKKLGVDDYFALGATGNDLLELMRLASVDLEELIKETSKIEQVSDREYKVQHILYRLLDCGPVKTELYLDLIGKSDIGIGITALRKSLKELEDRLKRRSPTDDEIRDMWLEKADLTSFGLGEWRRYTKGYWPAINELSIEAEIENIIENIKDLGIKPNRSLLSSVSKLAQVKVYQPDDTWNAKTDYFVCGNGTLHLPIRWLYSHDPEHYATSAVPYDYSSSAECPAWLEYISYLNKTLKVDVTQFLKEFAGYTLTTNTRHELAIWLYGMPGSGKSTYIEGLQAMLGDKAGVLGLADIQRSQFALANIPGKTLLLSTEQPSEFITTSHVINAIISGERLRVELKFKDAYEIVPQAKLIWAMNKLPRVKDPEDGIFRRIKIVKFPPLPASERKPELKERIKTEGAGILNWALDGLESLNRRGHFEIPKSVAEATQKFKDANDTPGLFVKEACLVGVDPSTRKLYECPTQQLYTSYSIWCYNNGFNPKSASHITEDWERLDFIHKHKNEGNFWLGVKPKSLL